MGVRPDGELARRRGRLFVPVRQRSAAGPGTVQWKVRQGKNCLGMVVTNPHLPALQRPLRSGSMGHAMPKFRIVILDESGTELGPGHEGQLAVDTQQSPRCWFRGYYHDAARTAERYIRGRYYLTGDAVSRDAEE
jgi:acetyl-CoA synthetase